MNCHDNKNEKEVGHKHSPLKHMLHMVICCGLPVLLVAFLPQIARLSPGAGNFIGNIAPFLCPLMMIPMMFMMMGDSRKKSCCKDSNEENNTKEIV